MWGKTQEGCWEYNLNRVVRDNLTEKVTSEQRGKREGESCTYAEGKSGLGRGTAVQRPRGRNMPEY